MSLGKKVERHTRYINFLDNTLFRQQLEDMHLKAKRAVDTQQAALAGRGFALTSQGTRDIQRSALQQAQRQISQFRTQDQIKIMERQAKLAVRTFGRSLKMGPFRTGAQSGRGTIVK